MNNNYKKKLEILILSNSSNTVIDCIKYLSLISIVPSVQQVSSIEDIKSIYQRQCFDILIIDTSNTQLKNMQNLRSIIDQNLFKEAWLIVKDYSPELANSLIKQGISNFILKTKLEKLTSLVEQYLTDVNEVDNNLDPELSNNILNAFISNATDVIWSKDLNGKYHFINEAGAAFLGQKQSSIVGSTDKYLFSLDTVAKIRASDIETTLYNRPVNAEFILDSLKGEKDKYYLSMKAPVHDPNHNAIGIVGIIRDITERKKLEQQLYKAKDEAIKANEIKSQFIANMSHELRTPLHNIITSSNIMVSGLYGKLDSKVHSYFEMINNNGNHLLQIVDDLLDISKIEAGRLVLDIETVRTNRFIESVCSLTLSLFKNKEQTLDVIVEKSFPLEFYCDFLRLKQALCNLLSNANKFSSESTTITLYCYPEGETDICFSVIDAGTGINPNDLELIFEPFEQGGSTSNISFSKGTGLGLPLSKKIVELHGGSIKVKSDLGKGSKFIISIPIKSSIKKELKVKVSNSKVVLK